MKSSILTYLSSTDCRRGAGLNDPIQALEISREQHPSLLPDLWVGRKWTAQTASTLRDKNSCRIFSWEDCRSIAAFESRLTDNQDVSATLHFDGGDQHLGQSWIQRELHHLTAQRRQSTRIIQRSQRPKLVHRIEHIFLRAHESKEQRFNFCMKKGKLTENS